MPLAVQGNHATVDGFHVSRLIAEVSDLAADPNWLDQKKEQTPSHQRIVWRASAQ